MSGERALGDRRVLELAHTLAGPYAALIRADLGCDVCKAEPRNGGDSSRRSLGRVQEWDEASAFFASNRNERSIALDLMSEVGVEAFHRLVSTAHVLVESFRPGVTTRLGIDCEAHRRRDPRLIYASVTGFSAHRAR